MPVRVERTAFDAIIALEGVPTGDGRMLERNAVTWGDGPWPLRFSPQGDHSTALVIGTITQVWRSGNDIRARGVLHDDSEDPEVVRGVQRTIELAKDGLAGLSVGLDDEDVEIRVKAEVMQSWSDPFMEDGGDTDAAKDDKGRKDKDGRITVAAWRSGDELFVMTSGRLREVTVTDQPAIVGAELSLRAITAGNAGPLRTEGAALAVHLNRNGQAGGAIAAANIDAAFADPKFGPDGTVDKRLVFQPRRRADETDGWGCPFTVEDDGRVYGHLAIDSRCHGAFQACVTAPDSDGDFSMFLTGEAVRGVPTGPIILGTTHSVNPDGTVKSYDHLANTGQAVADVTVGRDQHGTWVAGRVRPGITPAQLAALRGSALSGEWLPYGDRLRLAGILAVNSPGYLIERRAAKSDLALAAANGKRVYTMSPECKSCGKKTQRLATALARVSKKKESR